MSTIKVMLADAPTDVLVYLVDNGPTDIDRLIQDVPPVDTEQAAAHVRRALDLLERMGFAFLGYEVWEATVDGRAAVIAARSAELDEVDRDLRAIDSDPAAVVRREEQGE